MALNQSLPAPPRLLPPEKAVPVIRPAASGSFEPEGVVEFWHQLLAAKWSLAAIISICVLFGIILSVLQKPLYRAQTSIEIQDLNDKFMDMKELDPTDTTNYGAESYLQTQIRIAQSRSLVERTLAKLSQAERICLVEGLTARKSPLPQDQEYKIIAKRFDARPSRQARIIDLTFDSPDPIAGAHFLNALTQELADYSLERRWKTSQRTREWLERQLEDFRAKLERSERDLQDYARLSGLLFTSDKNNVAEAKLLQIQEELSRAQADRMLKQANFDRISHSAPNSLPEVIGDYTLRELHVRLADLKRQFAEMQSIYTPQHPAVLKLAAQVREMQSIFDQRTSSIVGTIKNEYESAEVRENLVRANFSVQSKLVSMQSEKTVHYNVLKRDVDTNRQIYDSMTTRMKEAGVASAIRATNIIVVDPAFPEKKPISPSLPFNAAAGALAGAFFGLIYILLRQRASSTFGSPGLTSRYLQVPELGAVPSDDYLRQLAVFSPGSKTSLQLAFDKKTASTESYRAIRSSILYQIGNDKAIRSLVFTSAVPGEGKTTVVSNLGAAMASSSKRVLVVDGDLRRPRLHEVLGVENDQGLADLLNDDPNTHIEFNPSLIAETSVPNLFILPAGKAGADAPELLLSERLHKVMSELTKYFDLVLVDAPSVLPYSDARSIGKVVDGLVLVVRAEATERRAALLARDIVLQDRIALIGTILTDWNAKKNTLHYYRTYRSAAWGA